MQEGTVIYDLRMCGSKKFLKDSDISPKAV